ncbi:MAG: cob(I)yrinic acid a,c-diamide adenosyltransferase [Suipraeoptans sp.]
MMKENGLIHIYCGDGKGKTTAATGLAVRCAGAGGKVLFARFLKNDKSGELAILKAVPTIELLSPSKSFGFYQMLDESQKAELKDHCQYMWQQITERIMSEQFDMLVMDEFMATYNYSLFDNQSVIHFLQHKPEQLEVVLTGRNPAQELIELADYVSEVMKIKHPFDRGVVARRGVEY